MQIKLLTLPKAREVKTIDDIVNESNIWENIKLKMLSKFLSLIDILIKCFTSVKPNNSIRKVHCSFAVSVNVDVYMRRIHRYQIHRFQK